MSQLTVEYDQDFYAWSLRNAALMRQGRLSEIDTEHLIEELESMAKREKRELINRLAILLAHLLKWQFQPARRSRSWQNTIDNQREDILELLAESPSLRREINERLAQAYKKALRLAEEETGLEKSYFPAVCPYTLDQALDETFYPGT